MLRKIARIFQSFVALVLAISVRPHPAALISIETLYRNLPSLVESRWIVKVVEPIILWFLVKQGSVLTSSSQIAGRKGWGGRKGGIWVWVPKWGQSHCRYTAPILSLLFLWWVKVTQLDKYIFNFPVILIIARNNWNIPRMCYFPLFSPQPHA